MAESKNDIITDIQRYITNCGGGLGAWYVGIAEDPRDRLFNDHSVDEESDFWIHHPTASSSVAREIEQYFLERGAQGGSGGGSTNTRSVYAYTVAAHTRE